MLLSLEVEYNLLNEITLGILNFIEGDLTYLSYSETTFTLSKKLL